MISHTDALLVKRTQIAFLCMRIMGTPFWCLLSMLAFILYKFEHPTPLQIAAIVALKPTTSLLSPYWTQAIYQRPDRITSNLLSANLFRHLPFLFIPWIHTPWYIIFSFGLYMMLTRATIPAWMEMFKYNLPESKREELVGFGTIVDYLGTAILAVVAGFVLDRFTDIWKWLFFSTASFGLLSSLFLTFVPSGQYTRNIEPQPTKFLWKKSLTQPWKQVWKLVSQHKDFTIFQVGFMLGGSGLMIMQPAFPQFFIDKLHLSFIEMGLAISLCKGLGVALTSSLWTKIFRKLNIFYFCSLVTFFATLFPFLLLTTSWHIALLYLAYSFYGIMQAGSELSWHMSGLIFAKDKDSSTFSTTNVLTVGVRGCIVPTLGSLLLPFMGPLGVILTGAFTCLFSSLFFFFHARSLKSTSKQKYI